MLVAVSGPAIDRMLSEDREYERAAITGGTYPANPADVRTFGVRAVVVTTTRMPGAVAHEITRAVFNNLDDFRRLHPAFEVLSVEEMVHATGPAPVHAGARAVTANTTGCPDGAPVLPTIAAAASRAPPGPARAGGIADVSAG